jgi:predicted small lipoprotein YifL
MTLSIAAPRRALTLLVLLAIALPALGACGRKGPPEPPEGSTYPRQYPNPTYQ